MLILFQNIKIIINFQDCYKLLMLFQTLIQVNKTNPSFSLVALEIIALGMWLLGKLLYFKKEI